VPHNYNGQNQAVWQEMSCRNSARLGLLETIKSQKFAWHAKKKERWLKT